MLCESNSVLGVTVHGIAIVCAIVLGVVLSAAGAAKIRMGRQWSIQARAMGAPILIAAILPWLEIFVGALLIARWQPWSMGLVAMFLIAAFSGVIIVNLIRGRRPVCACFGTWSAQPLGWHHLVRNAVLILLATIVVIS